MILSCPLFPTLLKLRRTCAGGGKLDKFFLVRVAVSLSRKAKGRVGEQNRKDLFSFRGFLNN